MATMQISVAEERADPFFLMQNIKKALFSKNFEYNLTYYLQSDCISCLAPRITVKRFLIPNIYTKSVPRFHISFSMEKKR